MSVRTLAQLREEVRDRADVRYATEFLSDAEVDRFINQSIRELYDLLIENSDQEFFATWDLIALDGSPSYPLPGNFYRLLGVDYAVGGRWVAMDSFRFRERNAEPSGTPRYRLRSDEITIIPRSTTGLARLWYIPKAVELIGDLDTFNGYNGWEEYVVVDAAAKCREKEQTDASELYARKVALRQRIESLAAKRDAGTPEVVTDVTGWDEP